MADTARDGKPYAVNPHVRFDEGETASARPGCRVQLYKKRVACLLLLAGMGAWAVTLSPVNLVDTYGVKEDGKLVVLGPEGSYDGKHGKECVYDGDTSTFIDPTSEVDIAGNGWAGFETRVPLIPTHIRYAGRVGMESRAKGCLFQGANTADFSDAVTLHVANPPSGWTGSSYVDVTLPFDPALRRFTYFRVWGPTKGTGSGGGMAGGNMAEVEFWGVEAIPRDASVPAKPAPAVMDTLNGHFNVRYTVPSGLLAVFCQRHLATDEADVWTDVVYPGWCPAAETVIFRDAAVQTADCTYRLGYVNSAGTSEWCVVDAPLRSYARGTVLGTNPWPDLPTCTKDKVWDGDIRTFYTGFAANGCWTGLDLGEGFSGRLAAIRYVPRGTASYEITRMVGRFQTADNPDFTDAVDFYTILSCPSVVEAK